MGFTADRYAMRKAASRQKIIESAFVIFSEKTIDAVNMVDVAHAAGIGAATVYRHFANKTNLVIAVSAWVWEQYTRVYQQNQDTEVMTAAEIYRFFLDSFIDLYRNHRDILRFNQFFNVYVQREDVSPELLQPFNRVIETLAQRFHALYEKAEADHTLRTDVPEREMFSSTLHLMLAVVTRYAVGLTYKSGVDPETELLFQRDLLLKAYSV